MTLDRSVAEIGAVEIRNYNGSSSRDFKTTFAEFSYFEDLFVPAISSTVVLTDASGYLNNFPFVGDEDLRLEFKTKGFDYIEGIDVNLRSYKVGQKLRISDRAISYPIQFTTRPAINDSRRIVTGFYEGRISDIVRTISKITPFDLPFAIEETDGLTRYVATGDTVFETIHKLRKEALSSVHKSSAFVFFQDRFGYKFVSLNSLFAQTPRRGNDFYFTKQSVDLKTLPSDITPIQIISSFDQIKSNDIIDGMKNGLYGNRTLTIDPLRKATNVSEFDYFGTGFNQTAPHASSYRFQPPISFSRDSQQSNRNLIISDLQDQNFRNYIQENSIDDYRFLKTKHKYFGLQKSLFEQSQSFAVRITIPGNSSLRVGDVINIYMPEASGTNEDLSRFDKYLHGKYLISSARHDVNATGSYSTTLDCIRDTFEEKIGTTFDTPGTDFGE